MYTVTYNHGAKAMRYQRYLCDTVDDVLSLPTAADQVAIGSEATCLEDSTIYILNNARHWVPFRVLADVDTAEVTVSTAGAVTQALDAGKMYHFTGALTSLTLTFNAAATGQLAQYHFDFTEGSTAFDPTLPSGVVLPDNHTWEADTRYEVDILNNYAVVVGWAVS